MESWKEKEEAIKEAPKPLQRAFYFNYERSYPNAGIPDGAYEKAIEYAEGMKHRKNGKALALAQQPEWTNIGPFSVGGRIKSIQVDPTNPRRIFAAAAAGGIWRTTTAGDLWEPIFDFENSIAFGSIAMNPENPQTIYAGTGEAVPGGGNIYLGSGMYKTEDGGDTWDLIGLPIVGAFSKVLVHPADTNIIYAGGIFRGQGFYLSLDAGASWERKYEGVVTDVSIDPSDPNIIMIGVQGKGVFYSNNLGQSWENRSSGLPSYGIGRVSVQMAPSNPDVVYSLLENSGVGEIYVSENRASSWNFRYGNNAEFFNGQGFYNNFIAVHPENESFAIAGGIDAWTTTDRGVHWKNTTNGYGNGNVHVDQHCACFDPSDSDVIWLGNDGGIYSTDNLALTWAVKNSNLQVSQFYGLGVDHSQDNRVYGGTQDNGTLSNRYSENAWQRIAGGDGFDVIVDYDDPDIIYGSSQYGNLFKIDFGENRMYSIMGGIPSSDQAIWDAPYHQDQSYNELLYHGRHAFYFSFDGGDDWEESMPGDEFRFTAVTSHPNDPYFVAAGKENGDFYLTDDGGFVWYDKRNKGLPAKYITDIEFSPNSTDVIYVTVSGYGNPHIWKTEDFGESWQNIDVDFPDVPVNSIELHPDPAKENFLVVGTDIGVFATYDGGATWMPFGRGLPRSPVKDLEYLKKDLSDSPILRCCTHGRSMWETVVPAEKVESPEIVSPAGGEIWIGSTSQRLAWSGFDPPVKIEYSLDDGEEWTTIFGNVAGTAMLWRVPNKYADKARIRITSATTPEQSVISRSFSISMKNKGSVLQSASVPYIPYGVAWDGKGGLWTTSFQSNLMFKLDSETLLRIKSVELPGDSLFTDLSFDRQSGHIYLHQLPSTTTGIQGAKIYKIDTTGKVIETYHNTWENYPVGIEFVDGKLLIGERDGAQLLRWLDVNTGEVLGETINPFREYYGPRGLCYDQERYVYQVGTDFAGNVLNQAYLMKIDKNDLSQIVDQIPLETLDGNINARGCEYDTRDDNLWVTEYEKGIFKIAGFNTSDVEFEPAHGEFSFMEIKVYPNPVREYSMVTFSVDERAGRVRIELTDLLGSTRVTLIDETAAPGSYGSATIDSRKFSPGVYYLTAYFNGTVAESIPIVVVE